MEEKSVEFVPNHERKSLVDLNSLVREAFDRWKGLQKLALKKQKEIEQFVKASKGAFINV